MKFTASTTRRMANPGKTVSHGLVAMVDWASMSMFPQVGVGGWTPNPRKLRDDSRMMAFPTASVAPTTMGPMALGRICRVMSLRLLAPRLRAASMKVTCLMARTSPRTTLAVAIQLNRPMMRAMEETTAWE